MIRISTLIINFRNSHRPQQRLIRCHSYSVGCDVISVTRANDSAKLHDIVFEVPLKTCGCHCGGLKWDE